MTKEQFLLELEHIAESGSNEIRLGELYEKVSTENEAEKRLNEYQDREERFILTLVKIEQSLNLLEKVQANEPDQFKIGIDHIKKNIRYVIDKNIDRLPTPKTSTP